jgi:hypothetical protein
VGNPPAGSRGPRWVAGLQQRATSSGAGRTRHLCGAASSHTAAGSLGYDPTVCSSPRGWRRAPKPNPARTGRTQPTYTPPLRPAKPTRATRGPGETGRSARPGRLALALGPALGLWPWLVSFGHCLFWTARFASEAGTYSPVPASRVCLVEPPELLLGSLGFAIAPPCLRVNRPGFGRDFQALISSPAIGA